MTSKAGVAYTYTDSAHKHAVTKLNGVQKYWYDANGNQTTRIVGSNSYSMSYDAENHLVGVSGAATATFVYGPGGERVKGVVGGVTTHYVGSHYEKQGSTVRKYHYAGAQRVAMREGATLYWLLSDHLGSQAIAANGTTGAKVAEVRYKAWGEDRYTTGTTPTSYRYTGQRSEASLGLYYYGARWYDAALSRFVQADTVVPDPGDPQSLDRYSYAANSPLRYVDPLGLFYEDELQALVGFGDDRPAFDTWFASLPESVRTLLLDARWGDVVSFTYAGETYSWMFVDVVASQGGPGQPTLGLWDLDRGVSVKLAGVLWAWAQLVNAGIHLDYIHWDSARHPLRQSANPLDGTAGECVVWDWVEQERLIRGGQIAGSIVSVMPGLPPGVRMSIWGGNLANAVFSWLGLRVTPIPYVHEGNSTEYLNFLYQQTLPFGYSFTWPGFGKQ